MSDRHFASNPNLKRKRISELRNATAWFRGSASEPIELQALPAELPCKQASELEMREAEPREQYVPRQEPGNESYQPHATVDPRKPTVYATMATLFLGKI